MLAASQEAVALHRRLAQEQPTAYEPSFTMSLDNLGLRLSQAGQPEQALVAIREAVAIRRRLAAANPVFVVWGPKP